MSCYAVIPAAGQGVRFGGDTRKQFLSLQDKPILLHTLEAFEASPLVNGVVLVAPESDQAFLKKLLVGTKVTKIGAIVPGGPTRQDSVKNGLSALPVCDMVLVHDGVRPLVSVELLARTIKAAEACGAAVPGLPVRETTKQVDLQGMVVQTMDRAQLWSIQTPQAFRYEVLQRAFAQAEKDKFYGTDEAMLVERLGFPVKVVMGEPWNLKITTAEDLMIAETFLRRV